MKRIEFNTYEDLVDKMIEVAEMGGSVYAICFIDDANEIVKELLSRDETMIAGINMAPEEYNGYEKEYYISLDADMLVDVEPAWHDKNQYADAGYLWFDAEAVFIVGDANSKIIKDIDKTKCYEIDFNFDEDDDCFDVIIDSARPVMNADGTLIGFEIDLDLLLDFIGE